MEAKDTVIKLKAVPNPIFEGKPNTYDTAAAYIFGWKEGADAQAEISFKAGYDKGYGEARNHCEDVLLPQEKLAGIKKVVDWINKSIPISSHRDFFLEGWQAQLKDWGL